MIKEMICGQEEEIFCTFQNFKVSIKFDSTNESKLKLRLEWETCLKSASLVLNWVWNHFLCENTTFYEETISNEIQSTEKGDFSNSLWGSMKENLKAFYWALQEREAQDFWSPLYCSEPWHYYKKSKRTSCKSNETRLDRVTQKHVHGDRRCPYM